jgi:peroxiredoxin Q/BCP
MPAMNAKKSATKKAAVRKTAVKKVRGKKAATTKTATTKAATAKSAKPAASSTAPARKPAPASAAHAGASLVAIGAQAPDFTLPDGAGTPVTLSALRGGPVVLYFYPKDDTSGCTAEACDFRDNLAAFRKLGCTVLGVSPDSVASHAKFAAKHALGKLTLLSDAPDASGTPAVCAAYGVWQQKSMYGRAYMGVVRTTYVIAADGTVAARFDKVSVTDHASEVLKALRGL